MKKFLAVVMAVVLMGSFAGCKKESKSALVDGNAVIGGADAPTDIVVEDEKETKEEKKNEDKKEDKKDEKKEESKEEEKSENSAEQKEEQPKVKPTFMYFVSNSDADYDKTMQTVESLKSTYGDKVVFDIVNVDEEPEALENFAMVGGNTPFLIMLNTSNDICGLKPKTSSEADLKAEIENAMK